MMHYLLSIIKASLQSYFQILNDNIINDSTARMEMVVGGKNITIINVSDAVEEGTTSVTDSKGVSHDCY